MRTLGGRPNMSGPLEHRDHAGEGILVEPAAYLHDVAAPQVHRDRLAPLRRRRLRHLYRQERQRRRRLGRRYRSALELAPPPTNSLRHKAALLREPLERKAAAAPRSKDASCFMLRPLTSMCHLAP